MSIIPAVHYLQSRAIHALDSLPPPENSSYPKSDSFKITDKNVISSKTLNDLRSELNAYMDDALKGDTDGAQKNKAIAAYNKALEEGKIADKIIEHMGLNDKTVQQWFKNHPFALTEMYNGYKEALRTDLVSLDTRRDFIVDKAPGQAYATLERAADKVFASATAEMDKQVDRVIQTKIGDPSSTQTNKIVELEEATDRAARAVYETTTQNGRPDVDKTNALHQAKENEYAAKLGMDLKKPGAAISWMTDHAESSQYLSDGIQKEMYNRLHDIDVNYQQKGMGIDDYSVGNSSDLESVKMERYLGAATGVEEYDSQDSNRKIDQTQSDQTKPVANAVILRQYAIEKHDGKYAVVDKLNDDKALDASTFKALKKVDPELHRQLQDKLTAVKNKQQKFDDANGYWERKFFGDDDKALKALHDELKNNTFTVRSLTQEEIYEDMYGSQIPRGE